MRRFGNGDCTEGCFHFTDPLNDLFQELGNVEMFRFDHNAGV
jgi:hypothetical protein